MNVELITDRSALPALGKELDALAAHDPRDGFFRSASWYLASLQYIRPDAEPLVITARNADDRLLGLAPLCRIRYREWGFNLAAAGFGGREVVSADFLDFLAIPESRPQVIDAILAVLWHAPWGLLVIGEILAGGELHTALASWADRSGLRIRQSGGAGLSVYRASRDDG